LSERILAVDTALGACSVAILDGGQILSHCFEILERGHAEALAPMVEAAMPLLTVLGVPDKHIYYDKFTTTGDAGEK